jgi:hypothetical protein
VCVESVIFRPDLITGTFYLTIKYTGNSVVDPDPILKVSVSSQDSEPVLTL